jgi:hypothetical protein
VVPDPVKAENVPPVTVTSARSKFDDVSESAKVMVSVCPALRVPIPLRLMVIVGTVVSIVTTSAKVDVWVSVTPSRIVVAVERNL